jgi:multiple sugar transport system substrate-binding protein
MRRQVKLWLICLIGASLATACGTHSEQGVRVASILGDPVLLKITNGIMADVEKSNPGLKIHLDTIPYNNYQEKISTELAAGDPPDVIFVEANNFVDLYLRGALEDLLPYIQRDGINLKDYYPDVIGRFTRDRHVCLLPQDTAPTGLVYYNKKIFREAGVPYPASDWSWPEPFLSICKKLVKKDASGKISQWAYCEAYPPQFDNFMYSNGGNFVDDVDHPTRFTMDTPQVIEALRFRWDMIHTYHISPSPSELDNFRFGGGGVENMFMNGQIAMMSSGIWHTPKFLEAKGLDFDVAEFPAGPKGLKGWGSGGSGFAMSKTCKNKAQAWKVIKALTSPEILSQLAATGMIQPALIKLSQSEAFLKSPGPAQKAILLQMPQYSHYQPFMANWGEIINGTFGPAMDPVWAGNKTPEKVLPAISKVINQKFFEKKEP